MTGVASAAGRIRVAQPIHAADIAATHRALFGRPWEVDGLQDQLERASVRGFIAEAGTGHAFAGFILGQLAADEAEILSIGVAPEWQRCGVAGLLTLEFAASAARCGAKGLFLEVAADNAAALALYVRQGFHCVGRRKCYYERRGAPFADALVLAKTL